MTVALASCPRVNERPGDARALRSSAAPPLLLAVIAAAEYLLGNTIAPANYIAAYGDSAGGLLVGAVVSQRPDLFDAPPRSA